MSIARFQFVILLIGTTCLLTGCSRKTSTNAAGETTASEDVADVKANAAGVATIDVNKIARDCGSLVDINRELDKREAEFNLILEGLRKIHLEAVIALEKKYGDSPSAEQQAEIKKLRNRQAAEYNAKWQDTRIKLSAIKQKLDEQFLTKLQPIAREVAQERGLSVVIREENVFCLVDQYDITHDVAQKFSTTYPRQESAPVVEVAKVPVRGGEFEPRK